MKRNMIITALAVAGIASYLFRIMKTTGNGNTNGEFKKKSHHLTNSFAKAKQVATEMVDAGT